MNRARFEDSLRETVAAAGGMGQVEAAARAVVGLVGDAATQLWDDPFRGVRELIAGYGPGGLETAVAEFTNLFAPRWTPDFLNQRDLAMLPILFVILWMYTGMYVIMFLANLQKIDSQVIEAARIDGASEGQVMRYVILPALSGVLVNSAILAISGSLNSFALIFAMTGGGPARITQILSIYMYDNAFKGRPDYPLANAIALVMVGVSFALIAVTKAVERRFGGKEE
jgi:raffinose/stachyose/melibiose transport system permease protein